MFNFSRDNTGKIAKWWRTADKQIFFSIILLLLLGVFFSFSSTSSIAGEKLNKETYFFFIKHLIFVIISLVILFTIAIQDKNKLEKFLIPLFIISILFLFSTLVIGVEVKGSRRWLDLPFFPRFQPVEIVKPLFIILISKIIVSKSELNIYFRYLFTLFILSFVVILLINQPDLGQVLLITASWFIIIFVSGINITILFFLGIVLVITIALAVYLFPAKLGYVPLRIKTFFDPTKGDNFQSQKALDAIKQGGLTGQGMGEGILKERVPEAHTDYIVAVISEEFGILLVLFIVLIFLFIAFKTLKKIFLEKDEFIKLVLVGLISLLIIQTFIHIGVNTRLLPTTGMTLPFLSYGGSSLVGSSLIAGIILNFTKNIPLNYHDKE